MFQDSHFTVLAERERDGRCLWRMKDIHSYCACRRWPRPYPDIQPVIGQYPESQQQLSVSPPTFCLHKELSAEWSESASDC